MIAPMVFTLVIVGFVLFSEAWGLPAVSEKGDIESRAIRDGVTIHFGDFMEICTKKHSELEEHLQGMAIAKLPQIFFRNKRFVRRPEVERLTVM